MKKWIQKMKNKAKAQLDKAFQIFVEHTEDFFIVFGILLIVGATLMAFGIGPAMYALGVFFILIGTIDPHKIRKGGEK